MATLTAEQFRETILARYETPAQATVRSDLASQLDESLRERVVQFWDMVLLLEFLVANPPTGEQSSILLSFHGDLERLVEFWQQSMLSIPRAALAPTDSEFRGKVMDLYRRPCEVALPTDIAQTLDNGLARLYVSFLELVFQLHYCATKLGRTRDPDLVAQIKVLLSDLLRMWKESILNRPRTRVPTRAQTEAKSF